MSVSAKPQARMIKITAGTHSRREETQQSLTTVNIGSNRWWWKSHEQGRAIGSQLGGVSSMRTSFFIQNNLRIEWVCWGSGVPNTNQTNPELESGSDRWKVWPSTQCMEAGHISPGCRNPSVWEERHFSLMGIPWPWVASSWEVLCCAL